MIVKYPRKLEIELTKDEAVEIFYSVKERIQMAIKNHWINYSDYTNYHSAFLESELISLGILKELSKIAGFSYETEILPLFLEMLKKQPEVK